MQYNHMRKSFPRVSYIVRAASQGLSRCPPLLKLVSRGYFTVLKDARRAHSSHRSVDISQCSQMQSWSPTDTQLDSMDRALGSPTAEMGQQLRDRIDGSPPSRGHQGRATVGLSGRHCIETIITITCTVPKIRDSKFQKGIHL